MLQNQKSYFLRKLFFNILQRSNFGHILVEHLLKMGGGEEQRKKAESQNLLRMALDDLGI